LKSSELLGAELSPRLVTNHLSKDLFAALCDVWHFCDLALQNCKQLYWTECATQLGEERLIMRGLHCLLLNLLCLLWLSNRLLRLCSLRYLSSRLNRLYRRLGLLRSSDNVGSLNNLFEDGVNAV
jgi:hypothetical protein